MSEIKFLRQLDPRLRDFTEVKPLRAPSQDFGVGIATPFGPAGKMRFRKIKFFWGPSAQRAFDGQHTNFDFQHSKAHSVYLIICISIIIYE